MVAIVEEFRQSDMLWRKSVSPLVNLTTRHCGQTVSALQCKLLN